MARAKKPRYEYHEATGLFRKSVKDSKGKYVALYGKTPEELTVKIDEFKESLIQNRENKDNPLVNDYAQTWLELHRGNLTFGSYTDYQSIIDRHIKPEFEDLRVREVRPNDIKRAMLQVADFSKSVHDKTYMLLKQIFTSAYENGLIEKNPCPKMHGGIEPKERTALTDEQISTLLDAIKGTDTYTFCMIGLYSGLRREEILGLKWDCVQLSETPCISVKRASRFEHNRPVVSESLKTKASRRVVPIPPQLVECLKIEKEKSKSEFVICGSSGEPISETQFRNLWDRIRKRSVGVRHYFRYVDGERRRFTVNAVLGEKARNCNVRYTIDFKVTPHILRHTYVTNLLLGGVDVKTVQYLAGHERAEITLNIYSHLTYNQPEAIMGRIAKAFQAN